MRCEACDARGVMVRGVVQGVAYMEGYRHPPCAELRL